MSKWQKVKSRQGLKPCGCVSYEWFAGDKGARVQFMRPKRKCKVCNGLGYEIDTSLPPSKVTSPTLAPVNGASKYFYLESGCNNVGKKRASFVREGKVRCTGCNFLCIVPGVMEGHEFEVVDSPLGR